MSPLMLAMIVLCLMSSVKSMDDTRRQILQVVTASKYFLPEWRDRLDILEDSLMDTVELINKRGYPVEIHRVVTGDGYVLTMHRIPNGPPSANNGIPVMLMHGFSASSADWVWNNASNSLGYFLSDQGFDVWLGNSRGNYYSREHTSLDPDKDEQFWDYSWHEIAVYDLPAMMDHILQITNREALHYVGYSQGAEVFFAMLSDKPDYNRKIISMQGLGASPYLHTTKGSMFESIYRYTEVVQKVSHMGQLLDRPFLLTVVANIICAKESIFQRNCTEIHKMIFGPSEQVDSERLPVYLSHSPSGASLKQLIHFGQIANSNIFRRFDYGITRNIEVYGMETPPEYDLSNVTAPVFLYYSSNDYLSLSQDVRRLHRALPNSKLISEGISDYSHMDYICAKNARKVLFPKILKLLVNN